MRVKISADGVTTENLRSLLAALAKHSVANATVGLDGPDHWAVETPKMFPNQFADVVGDLVKYEGVPISEHVEGWRS